MRIHQRPSRPTRTLVPSREMVARHGFSLRPIAFLLLLAAVSNALHFYLDASERRCFIEELPTDTVVEGMRLLYANDTTRSNLISCTKGHYKALEWSEQEQKYFENPNLGMQVEVDVSPSSLSLFPSLHDILQCAQIGNGVWPLRCTNPRSIRRQIYIHCTRSRRSLYLSFCRIFIFAQHPHKALHWHRRRLLQAKCGAGSLTYLQSRAENSWPERKVRRNSPRTAISAWARGKLPGS